MGDLARINETLAERARDQLSGARDQLGWTTKNAKGWNHEEREEHEGLLSQS